MAELHDVANALRHSSLHSFVRELEESSKQVGDLHFNPERIELLRAKLQKETFAPMEIVQQVVRTIDVEGTGVCKHLDVLVFSLLVEIVLKSQPSIAQRRGFLLLTVSLQTNTNRSIADKFLDIKNATDERKVQVGNQLLIKLLEYFTDQSIHDTTRRFSGLFIIQLLENNGQNQQLTAMAPGRLRRALGLVAVEMKRRYLNLLARSIIRIMVDKGSPIDDFYPPVTGDYLAYEQPLSAFGWIGRTENIEYPIVDEVPQEDPDAQIFQAYAVASDHFNVDAEMAMLQVSVSEDLLTINVPRTSQSPARVIDMGFDLVHHLTIKKAATEAPMQRADLMHDQIGAAELIFTLLPGAGTNFWVNNNPYYTTELRLTFESLHGARFLVTQICATTGFSQTIETDPVTGNQYLVVTEEAPVLIQPRLARDRSQIDPVDDPHTPVSKILLPYFSSAETPLNPDSETRKISCTTPLANRAALPPSAVNHITTAMIKISDTDKRPSKPPMTSLGQWNKDPAHDTHHGKGTPAGITFDDDDLYGVSHRGAKLLEQRTLTHQDNHGHNTHTATGTPPEVTFDDDDMYGGSPRAARLLEQRTLTHQDNHGHDTHTATGTPPEVPFADDGVYGLSPRRARFLDRFLEERTLTHQENHGHDTHTATGIPLKVTINDDEMYSVLPERIALYETEWYNATATGNKIVTSQLVAQKNKVKDRLRVQRAEKSQFNRLGKITSTQNPDQPKQTELGTQAVLKLNPSYQFAGDISVDQKIDVYEIPDEDAQEQPIDSGLNLTAGELPVTTTATKSTSQRTQRQSQNDDEIKALPQHQNKLKRKAAHTDLRAVAKKGRATGELKRKAAHTDLRAMAKKERATAELNARFNTPTTDQDTKPEKTQDPPPALVDDFLERMPPMIKFTASGPRNQGTKPVKQAQPTPQDEILSNPKNPKHYTLKRKFVGGVNEHRDVLSPSPPLKRQKRSTPITLNTVISRRRRSTERSVTLQGSPIPIIRHHGVPDYSVEDRFVLHEDYFLPDVDRRIVLDRELSRVNPDRMSLLSKARPDSPTAPSKTLAAQNAHLISSDGEFVDVETNTVVRPTNPDDPFGNADTMRPTRFMERLFWAMAQSGDHEDPPAPPPPPQAQGDEVTTSPTGTTSTTSPSSSPPTGGESDSEEGEGLRGALGPHQSRMLGVLYEVADRLVCDLVEREGQAERLREEYDRGGRTLVEGLRRAHQGEWRGHREGVVAAVARLGAAYAGTMAQVRDGNREVASSTGQGAREVAAWQRRVMELVEGGYRALE